MIHTKANIRRRMHVVAALIMIAGVLLAYLPALSADAGSAVIAAATSGDAATLGKLLRQGANPDAIDRDGISALEWASAKGHLAAVEALLHAHAAVDGAHNPSKYTPLMRAARFGFREIVAALITAGANVNARATTGQTALDFAIIEKYASIVTLLKSHGAKTGIGTNLFSTLCGVGGRLGFSDGGPGAPTVATRFSCVSQSMDPSIGEVGSVLMFYYEVDGPTAASPRTIGIDTDIAAESVPKEGMARTLLPLLRAIYSAGGKGPIPSALADAIGNAADVREDTAFGYVTASYRPGPADASGHTYNGAKYTIRITLH